MTDLAQTTDNKALRVKLHIATMITSTNEKVNTSKRVRRVLIWLIDQTENFTQTVTVILPRKIGEIEPMPKELVDEIMSGIRGVFALNDYLHSLDIDGFIHTIKNQDGSGFKFDSQSGVAREVKFDWKAIAAIELP